MNKIFAFIQKLFGSSEEEGHYDRQAMEEAFQQIVLESLTPTVLVLGLMFVFLAFTHYLGGRQVLFPDKLERPMMLVNGLSGLFLVAMHFWHRRFPPKLRHAHSTLGLIAILIAFNLLYHLYLSNDPILSVYVVLLFIGAGFFFLSTPWYLFVTLASGLAWVLIAVFRAPQTPTWGTLRYVIGISALIGYIIHVTRIRTYRRLELLRQEQLRQQKEIRNRANQLETLIQVAQSVSSILDLDKVLNEIAELVKERFGYYFVGIFLVDETQKYMVARAGTGSAGRWLTEQAFKLKIGEEGLIGWVAQHRRTARVNDVTLDPRYLSVDIIPNTRSELVLPLLMGDTFLGVLDLQSDQPHAFSEDDEHVFDSLADQVAIAIHNAQVYSGERSRRLLSEMLYEVSRALSQSLDVNVVLRQVLDSLSRIVPFDRGSMMLQEGNDLVIVAARGFPPGSNPTQIRVAIKSDDVYQTLRSSGAPLIVPDVLQRPDWQHVPGLPMARSWMGVPLIQSENEIIGMLSLTRETPTPFTEEQASLATAFASQAAIALKNAQLYAQLERAYAQLEKLDRTKSDFITVASHELRTPITVLRGFSQILLKNELIKRDPTLHEMIQGIYDGAIRLHEIVNSMLDMAKIDSNMLQLSFEPIAISALLKSTQENFAQAVRERAQTLEIESIPEGLVVEGDPEALRKVLYHLVLNAIKYTPDGGRITLGARPLAPGEAGFVHGGVELWVHDTGIGIDPQYQELIFTKFYQTGEVALHSSGRTKFKGGGPGLGLAIAKGIVEAHGGKLRVESPGYNEETCPGSTFYVSLPHRSAERAKESETAIH